MKVVLFLSRFTFICNIAFLLYVFFRWLEGRKASSLAGDKVLEVPFFKNLIITLGFTAVFINLLMIIVYLYFLFAGKIKNQAGWLAKVNILFFLVQVYYFFLL